MKLASGAVKRHSSRSSLLKITFYPGFRLEPCTALQIAQTYSDSGGLSRSSVVLRTNISILRDPVSNNDFLYGF